MYRTRVGYHSFDMEPNVDFMRYRDTAGTELGSDTGARGWAWSGWMTPAPADRKVNLVLQSNATNESVVNTQWCEYRASDAAVASPFWIPLRFPGQYWDRESDYFENWNRYYDPWTGRYLQPEPMMSEPVAIVLHSSRDLVALTSYLYVGGNPVSRIDPSGENGLVGLGAVGVLAGATYYFYACSDKCMKKMSDMTPKDPCGRDPNPLDFLGVCASYCVRPGSRPPWVVEP